MRIIPREWLPQCAMRRVITHWTASPSSDGHRASESDRKSYHILIEGDGKLVRGTHSILDNVSTSDKIYAAHTLGANTSSIGVTVCAMGGAGQTPFRPGPFHMTKIQWETMALVVADLCEFYGIPVSPTTVLGHGEVQAALGIPQKGKWDPMVLPWDPKKTVAQVGDEFRSMVSAALVKKPADAPRAETIKVELKRSVEGRVIDGKSFVPLRAVANHMGWSIKQVTGSEAVIVNEKQAEIVLPLQIIDGVGYAPSRNVAEISGIPVTWTPSTRTVTIG
jgi:hypothetical protein